MTLFLPRLPGSGQIVSQTGVAAPSFLRWWNEFASAIESSVNGIAAVEAQVTNALGLATSADAAAGSASTAANGATVLAGGILADTALNTSYVSGINISATDAGASASIAISAHTRVYGDGTSVSVNGATLTGLAYSTSYYLFYDDAARAGGAVSYQTATTVAATGFNGTNINRHVVGAVVTPAALGAAKPGVGTLPAGLNLPSGFVYA